MSSLTWERRFKLRRSLSRSVWPIPSAFIVLGIGLGAQGFPHPQKWASASIAAANGVGSAARLQAS